MRWTVAALLVGLGLPASGADADDTTPLAEYFRLEVARIAARPLLGIDSAEAWKARRPELQAKLRGMLGLDPWPDRTPLRAEVTGTVERPDFVVEKVLFQSSPGLYVTGNLYRPKVVDRPLPAVLYVCGHSKVEKDGVILGCKVHYQRHPAWYASNGYVCLILDTLQLGELPGLHHGTSKFGMWWWSSLGYTPAGVEAWNAVRAIDYLVSRPEVDAKKIGVTGRSGGGATSWWVGAIDDRVAAVVAVAGITDLKNHVVDGAVEGHCDCMYTVNTERWDFDTIAALVAPKPLLVENTDADSSFPEDGVRRIYSRLETAYRWYGASDRLGLVIGKGDHFDTAELRHPSFAFMDKWLKGISRPIVEPDRSIPEDLLVVVKDNRPPLDNLNQIIHERFRKPAPAPARPQSWDEWLKLRDAWRAELQARVLAGCPTADQSASAGLDLRREAESTKDGVRIARYSFHSQPGVRLPLWTLDRPDGEKRMPTSFHVVVLDEAAWGSGWGAVLAEPKTTRGVGDGTTAWMQARNVVLSGGIVVAIAPRGVGPTSWPAAKDKQIRRRFLLLGQTLDGMRAWDVRMGGIAAYGIRKERAMASQESDSSPLTFQATGEATSWLILMTALGRDPIGGRFELTAPPTRVRGGPAFLNLESTLEMPQLVALLGRDVHLMETSRPAWSWTVDLWSLPEPESRLDPIRGTPTPRPPATPSIN